MSVVILSRVLLAEGLASIQNVLGSAVDGFNARFGMGLSRAGAGARTNPFNGVGMCLDALEQAPGVPVGESVVFRGKGGVAAEFFTDGSGRVGVRVTGPHPEDELRRLGEELAGRVVQQYAYHHLVTEMKSRHMNVVDETVEQNGTVRLRVRVHGG